MRRNRTRVGVEGTLGDIRHPLLGPAWRCEPTRNITHPGERIA
jgi:hypothetical protein